MFEETVPGSLVEADAALTNPPAETEEVAAEPAAEPEGQPRDEAGRFTSTPKEESEAPESGDEIASPESPDEPAEAPDGEEAEWEVEPFTYRADGQDFDIPGSDTGEDGVFIPKDSVPELQQLLSSGKAAMGSVRQHLSEAAAREQAALDRAAAAEEQSTRVLAQLEDLVEKSQNATTLDELVRTPLGQWLLGVRTNWPVLKAEAKAKAVELAQASATKELQQYRDREQQEKLRPLMEQTLQQSVRMQAQQFGLDEQTIQAVARTLGSPQYQSFLYPKAPYDDPANGIRKGDTVIDHGVVRSALELASINRVAPAQQQKIAAAMKQNQQQTKSVKVPPTVGGKGRAPRAGGVPVFKTAKEADDFLVNGDLDQFAPEEET